MPGVKLRRNQINTCTGISSNVRRKKYKQVQNKSKYLAKSMCESRDSFIYFIHKCIGQCVEIRKIIVFWI